MKANSISKLRPRRPTQFFQRKSRDIDTHRPDRIENRIASAFESAAANPELRIHFQFFVQLNGKPGCAHQILLRPGSSECADTKNAATVDRLSILKGIV